MKKLCINDFLFISDFEMSQYKILGALKDYRMEFHNNKVLSLLSELTELVSLLIRVEKKRSQIVNLFPLKLEKIDAQNRQVVFEDFVLYDEDIERIFSLIKWAIPEIHDTIDQGLCLTKIFIKENPTVLV